MCYLNISTECYGNNIHIITLGYIWFLRNLWTYKLWICILRYTSEYKNHNDDLLLFPALKGSIFLVSQTFTLSCNKSVFFFKGFVSYSARLHYSKPALTVIVTVLLLLLSLVVFRVMVELLLRNLLMTMWNSSDCHLFRSCCDPFDGVAAVVILLLVVVLLLLQVQWSEADKEIFWPKPFIIFSCVAWF